MKISQLVATKNTKQYHESVASRLPRGIKSQQQLLNLGYSIAVHDLGLTKANSLNENFAAKLVNSYHKQCLEEGVGSFLGKAAGHVAGAVGAAGRGLKGAWNDAKAGYQSAKASWDPKTGAAPATPDAAAAPTANGTAPTSGTSTAAPPAANASSDRPYVAPASGTSTAAAPAAPAPTASGDMGSIMQAIDKLDKPSKQQLAGELEKSIASTPEPAAAAPDELDAVKKNAGIPAGTPPAAPGAAPAAPQGQALDLDQLKKDKEAKLAAGQADQQQAQQQMAATAQSNAATSQQDAAIKAAADAAKAKPAFQQSASDKLAIKQAADKGIKEAEEIAEGFHSNFLGMKI